MAADMSDQEAARAYITEHFGPSWAIDPNRVAALVKLLEDQREADAKLAWAEPELPGEMPDEMWSAIQGDRDAVAAGMRIAVHQTKSNIVAAIRNQPSGVEGDSDG